MEKAVFTSLSVEDLQTVIIDCVNSCLRNSKHSGSSQKISPEIVDTKYLCKFLNVTEPTVIRWRKKGKIPFLSIGTAIRFNLPSVIEALDSDHKKKGARA